MVTLLDIAMFFGGCLLLFFVILLYQWWNPKWIVDSNETRCKSPGLYPAKFPEQNHVVGQGKHPAMQVPARIDMTDRGHVMTTCWQFTLRDRLKILLMGKLWASTWVFDVERQRPYFSVDKRDVLPKIRARRVH